MDSTNPVIENVAVYLECLPLEAASSTWSVVIPLCETFLRKIVPLIQPPHGTDGLLRMMAYIMRLPGISAYKVRQSWTLDIQYSFLQMKFRTVHVTESDTNSCFYVQGILDPFSKIVSIIIQNSVLKYSALVELCHLCHRGFMRVTSDSNAEKSFMFALASNIVLTGKGETTADTHCCV